MSSTSSVPAAFGLVMGVVGVSALVHHVFMGFGVSSARKKYGIKYPDLYASSENCKNEDHRKKFNCIQRAHQNSLENQPAFLATLLAAGTVYPITASALGLIHLAGKVAYFLGYSTGVPDKRQYGAFGYIGTLGLTGICLTLGFKTLSNLVAPK